MLPRVLYNAKKCKCFSSNKGIIFLVGIYYPFCKFHYSLFINALINFKWFGTAFDIIHSKSKENEQTNFRIQKN